MFYRGLPIFRGITNVLRMRSGNVRKFLFERRNDVASFVQAQSGLRKISHAIGIWDRKRFHFFGRSYQLRYDWRLAQRSDHFIVIAMTDQDERIAILGKLHGFTWTLVTSGHVASMTRNLRRWLFSRTSGET